MKNKLIYLFSFFFCSLSSWGQTSFTLVFSDEFDGTTLDLSKWTVQSGYAANQEKEYYTAGNNNLRVEDGNLVIVARKEQAVSDRNYTSARINSKGKGFTKYGKIEARISVPSGAGTWPAFWMMPEANVYGTWPKSGEIDIMEHVGSDPTMISHAVHTANKNGSLGNNWFNKQYLNVENVFHVYSIIWQEDNIKFYIDDVKSVTLYRNLTEDYKGWPFDQNFYVILNLALGGTMGGTINDDIFNNPVEMKVDYVRIYQNSNTSVDKVDDDQIEVFPVKFSNEIQINTKIPVEIKLYDIYGKQMLQKKLNGDETIRTDDFPKGVYLLSTKDRTYKLVK